MRLIVFFALSFAAAPLPAMAQADASPAPPPAASAGSSLPLDAMRHHQPTATQVQAREDQREGTAARKRQGASEQSEIDRLYEDAMQRSAPTAESAPNAR